jgi:hypothetical protein
MSSAPIVQYLGFQAKLLVREYTFTVRDAGTEREFVLNIENAAFVSHRARYQDAPAICALRLNAELAAHSNHPPESQFDITAAELEGYRQSHSAKTPASPYGRKAESDF